MDTNIKNKNKDIDWSRYGLGSETAQRVRANTSGFVDLSSNFDYSIGGHQASGANELFAEEQGDVPWWKSNFFISQPVLFGTWDGVFTSCLINIFGVIVFLRSGWIVAEAGVFSAVLIVLSTVFIALISVLSAVGICERCRIESGGVYFVIAHVLGSRFGGSLGLLYCFGQAVGCALNVLGFGESMAELIGLGNSIWAVRFIAGAAVLLLGVINVAGVKWVIKLQFILLIILLLAGLDFMVGSFTHTDIEHGVEGWLSNNLKVNMWSNYSPESSWFIVFGVFFPTITGILSGINMSGDLKAPSTNIPNGSLAAISTGTFLYLVFVIFLGATCTRSFLMTDYTIAAKVSASSVLLLAGLYVSSMSSCLGAMYGTPRVLQSVALENVIPGIGILGTGRGPNKVPLYSMGVVASVTLAFILIGEINMLAPIVTMPFLLTYASIDYAYFALAQTFDIQHQREQRFHKPRVMSSSIDSEESDLDRLFPERTRHKTLRGESSSGSPSSPEDSETTPIAIKTHIHSKPKNWYSNLCNRWLSLFGAVLKILIMFLVNWVYAMTCIMVVFFVWLYIGTANPAVKPGLASEFRLLKWMKLIFLRCLGVLPFFLVVSTLILNVKVLEEGEFINPIRFPFGGPFMGIFVALSFPLGLKEEDISLSVNLEANYVLPENQSILLYPPIYGERAITRMTAFNFIQKKLSEYGYPGYPCLLRMICDIAVHPIKLSNGVLGDLLYTLLTPSSSVENGLPAEYETAERYGLKNGHCKKYHNSCSDSIVDFFSAVFSVEPEAGGE